jgi:two-component system phosphate regulon response regulator PhoB
MDLIATAFVEPAMVLGLAMIDPADEERPTMDAESRLCVAEVELDLLERRMYVAGAPVDCSPTEFRVLAVLLTNAHQTMTREQILFGVHHEELVSTPRAIDFQIFSLRKKLGPAARHLKTVRGVGYRFEPPTHA